MATQTTNYQLHKIDLTDAPPDITVLNPNWDKIDAELAKRATLGSDGKVISDQLPDLDYIPTSEKGAAGGVPTLDDTGKVPESQLPDLDFVPQEDVGQPNGVASLDQNGKVPTTQLPEMDYIENDEKGAPNGVATLGADGKVPYSQLPDIVTVTSKIHYNHVCSPAG